MLIPMGDEMKVFTAWWGVQIVAENDKEKNTLQELYRVLPEKADDYYEEGGISVYYEDEIEEGKYMLEFVR